MFEVKTKQTIDDQYTSGYQKHKMDIFISLRPGKARWIFNRYFFYNIMKIVLNNGSSKNKSVKTKIIKRNIEHNAGFQAKCNRTNRNKNARE